MNLDLNALNYRKGQVRKMRIFEWSSAQHHILTIWELHSTIHRPGPETTFPSARVPGAISLSQTPWPDMTSTGCFGIHSVSKWRRNGRRLINREKRSWKLKEGFWRKKRERGVLRKRRTEQGSEKEELVETTILWIRFNRHPPLPENLAVVTGDGRR